MPLSLILTRISRACVYLTVLLLPLFFLPFTPDIFDFNKQYLLYALTTAGVLSWLLAGILERSFTISRTALDLPLLAVGAIFLISSIFSKDRTLSFFGSYDRLTIGFIPLTFYLLFFYLLVQHIREYREIRRLLWLIGIGGIVAALYFWLRVLGVGSGIGQIPAWNPLAATNSRFAVGLMMPLLAALTSLLRKDTAVRETIFWGLAAAAAFITIVALGSKIAFLAGIVAIGIALVLLLSHLEHLRIPASSLMLVGFLAFLIFAIFGVPRFLTISSLPVEVSLAHGTSWGIAGSTLKEGVGRGFIGSGPATFGYDFSAHRPELFNKNLFWTIRFGTPFSEAAGIAATTGILGALGMLFLFGASLWFFVSERVVRTREEAVHTQLRTAMALWAASFSTLFFISFSTVLWLYFVIALGLFVVSGRLLEPALTREHKWSFSRTSPQRALSASFGIILMFAVLTVFMIYLGRFYAGEAVFRRGTLAAVRRDLDGGIRQVARASAMNPQEVRYPLTLAQFQFARAIEEAQKTERNSELTSRLVVAAVQNARRATELAPRSAEAWQTLAEVYSNVVVVAPEARGWAIDAYSRAIELEVTNPILYVSRATQRLAGEQYKEAREDLGRALELKENFARAHAALAFLEDAEKNIDAAIAAQEKAVQFAPQDSEALVALARYLRNRQGDGDFARAKELLDAVLARSPDYANALFIKASILEGEGNILKARELYRKILESNPDSDEVKDKLKSLESVLPSAEE